MKEKLLALFADDGPLSKQLTGFETRQGQLDMLVDVLEAYQGNKITLIEAGTGTGKSLAYLIPALFWTLETGEVSVISTNTIALQEQLIKKDIPFLLNALKLDLKAVLVKGMNNYLCKRKLDDVELEKKFLDVREHSEIEKIEEWNATTKVGSRAELGFASSSETWERVSADAESCTHVKCPHYKECFFFKARKEAADAQILVANHHLLFADLNVRGQTGNYNESCILPPYKRLVLDEAHHTEDVATEHFAQKVSRFSFFKLINRLLAEKGHLGKLRALQQKLGDLLPEVRRDQKIHALFSLFDLEFPMQRKVMMEGVDRLFKSLLVFCNGAEKLRLHAEHMNHPLWADVQEKAREVAEEGKRWMASIEALKCALEEDEVLHEKCEGILADITGLTGRIEHSFEVLMEFVFAPISDESVRWVEISANQNVHLIIAKLDIATLLSETLFEKLETVVLTSATLATKRDFKFIKTQLGIKQAQEKLYDSPFDYENQARLFVPLDMPHPDHADFGKIASEQIKKAVFASGGGAFVLFTSYSMLLEARQELLEWMEQHNYLLLCQGQMAPHALLNKFRTHQNAVLFGTDSFWEGVDVQGEALRCVVIAKLPFLVPSEPLFQAKSEKMVKEGKSPFFEYSLPHAAMKFKQGFGRLIRSKSCRGCVVCLDARLATKGYGKVFLGSLPVCPSYFGKREEIEQRMKEFYQRI